MSTEAQKKWLEKNPEYMNKWYQENRESNRQKDQNRYREKISNEPWVIMFRRIKTRAKQKGLEFNLTEDYLKSIWIDTCPVLGIPLRHAVYESGLGRQHKAKPQDSSPTLDRIDSSKGYIIGNVCLMSYRANMIKNCGTLEEHQAIVRFLSGY